MELPGKMKYEPRLYVRLHRTLYPTFGRVAGPGAAPSVRRIPADGDRGRVPHGRSRHFLDRRPTGERRDDAVAARLYSGSAWPAWRDRWEYGHAIRTGLVTTALGALTL